MENLTPKQKMVRKSLQSSPLTELDNSNGSITNTRANQTAPVGRKVPDNERINSKTGKGNERMTTEKGNEGEDNNKRIKSSTVTSATARSSSSTMSKLQMIIKIPIRLIRKMIQNPMVQKFMSIPITICIFLLFKKVLLHHKSLEYFFVWMEEHPNKGMAAYLIIYPFHMLFFLPGTPLVMGAGYIFTIRFGWLLGVSLCSIITLFGSLIGSIMCFLVGRYCMRSAVRRWSKKYPLFDPIDAGKFGSILPH